MCCSFWTEASVRTCFTCREILQHITDETPEIIAAAASYYTLDASEDFFFFFFWEGMRQRMNRERADWALLYSWPASPGSAESPTDRALVSKGILIGPLRTLSRCLKANVYFSHDFFCSAASAAPYAFLALYSPSSPLPFRRRFTAALQNWLRPTNFI